MDQFSSTIGRHLHAYLLGGVHFTDALALQRRLVYEVSGERSLAVLLMCEHPPTITLGRLGSHADVSVAREELDARNWPLRWVNRGAGTLLHSPGQLAMYPILALDEFGLTINDYLDYLHEITLKLLGEFHLEGQRGEPSGIFLGGRQIAHIGVAIRDWVSYYGISLNINPDLALFRQVRCDGHDRAMTSLQRELRLPVSPTRVRQRLLEFFCTQFGIEDWAVFHQHHALPRKATLDAVSTRYRQSI